MPHLDRDRAQAVELVGLEGCGLAFDIAVPSVCAIVEMLTGSNQMYGSLTSTSGDCRSGSRRRWRSTTRRRARWPRRRRLPDRSRDVGEEIGVGVRHSEGSTVPPSAASPPICSASQKDGKSAVATVTLAESRRRPSGSPPPRPHACSRRGREPRVRPPRVCGLIASGGAHRRRAEHEQDHDQPHDLRTRRENRPGQCDQPEQEQSEDHQEDAADRAGQQQARHEERGQADHHKWAGTRFSACNGPRLRSSNCRGRRDCSAGGWCSCPYGGCRRLPTGSASAVGLGAADISGWGDRRTRRREPEIGRPCA